jgi:hypothetical protein
LRDDKSKLYIWRPQKLILEHPKIGFALGKMGKVPE